MSPCTCVENPLRISVGCRILFWWCQPLIWGVVFGGCHNDINSPSKTWKTRSSQPNIPSIDLASDYVVDATMILLICKQNLERQSQTEGYPSANVVSVILEIVTMVRIKKLLTLPRTWGVYSMCMYNYIITRDRVYMYRILTKTRSIWEI